MNKHHTPEEMRALADRLQDATRSTYYASGMNAAAAMLRDIADAADTTCSDPVAYCDPFDGTNSTAFAWPGKSRDLSRHTLPLYKKPMPRDDVDSKDREDAERYRWLRNDPPLELAVRRKNPNPLHGDCAFTYLDADILDQAIDAARKASP